MPLFLSLAAQTVIYRSLAINNNHAYDLYIFFNVMNYTVLHTFKCSNPYQRQYRMQQQKYNDEKQVKQRKQKIPQRVYETYETEYKM